MPAKPDEVELREKIFDLMVEFELPTDSLFMDEIIALTNTHYKKLFLDIIGENDRDYSKDNADEQSLAILVACSTACNELKQELRQAVEGLK